MNRIQRQREENRRLVAGEGTLRQIQKTMRAEATNRGEKPARRIGGWLVVLMVLVIAAAGALIAVAVVNGIASAGAPGAKARLIAHHCSTAANGSELVTAQLGNVGKTGKVEASGYALLSGGKVVNVDGWQYEKSIRAGSSDFINLEVPLSPGERAIGCGVLLGAGAPRGVTYLPPAP